MHKESMWKMKKLIYYNLTELNVSQILFKKYLIKLKTYDLCAEYHTVEVFCALGSHDGNSY